MSRECISWAFLFLITAFVCGGCNTCWQCPQEVKDGIKIGQETKELLEVNFESAEGRRLFFKGLLGKLNIPNDKTVRFSNVLFWDDGDVDSQNSVMNEGLRNCDTNGDLIITDKEAEAYHKASKEKDKNEK